MILEKIIPILPTKIAVNAVDTITIIVELYNSWRVGHETFDISTFTS